MTSLRSDINSFAITASLAIVALNVINLSDASAQNYPTRPLRYMVSGSPGSGTDTLGRLVAEGLTQTWAKQVSVENHTGGGSNIVAELVAKSPADGYTLFQSTITHAVNVSLYHNLTYNILTDFTPITLLATGPSIVVVHPSLPVKSIAELVKLAKAKPGAINYASGGTGTFTFMAAELFKGQAGIDLMHIPYKGGGAALNAVIAGEVSVYFAPIAVGLPPIQQGRLRALAVTTLKRVALAPQLPTVNESGVRGYESGNWYGLLVPAKTPKEITTTIRNATIAVLNSPTMTKRLNDLGFVAVGNTPEEFSAYMRLEIDRLGKIVRKFNLTAED